MKVKEDRMEKKIELRLYSCFTKLDIKPENTTVVIFTWERKYQKEE